MLALWARDDDLGDLYGDPLAVWSAWAEDRRGGEIACGHHMAEEAPDDLVRALDDFVRRTRDGRARGG